MNAPEAQLASTVLMIRPVRFQQNPLTAASNAFMEDIGLLPRDYQQAAKDYEKQQAEAGRARAVADYIAGMTDRYAITEYGRIFDPVELT